MPEPRPYMTDAAADALIASVLDRLFEVESGLPPDVSERMVAGLLGRHLEYALRESPAAGGLERRCRIQPSGAPAGRRHRPGCHRFDARTRDRRTAARSPRNFWWCSSSREVMTGYAAINNLIAPIPYIRLECL
jgi:hypothetical protein